MMKNTIAIFLFSLLFACGNPNTKESESVNISIPQLEVDHEKIDAQTVDGEVLGTWNWYQGNSRMKFILHKVDETYYKTTVLYEGSKMTDEVNISNDTIRTVEEMHGEYYILRNDTLLLMGDDGLYGKGIPE